MENSILTSTKKILGVEESYDVFDQDIITHINATFSILHQLGIGPEDGLFIDDASTEWEELTVSRPAIRNLVKTYVYLKVRYLFDPPGTSFHLKAMDDQIKEYEWRLTTLGETTV